ncbi:hypothetical protein GOV11_00610, partial [Candidatus Woesearchaeota archaeon]|nr:hypothetical protein [Candidatus Woesearchaeota archaeon]
MRKFITGIIFVLLFLAACSSEVQTKLADDPVVELYGAMSGGDLEFTEMRFAGKEAEDMRELISSECPNDVGEAFTRLTIRGRGSSMVAYTSPDGETVFCSLFKSNKDTVSYISPDDAPEGVVLVVNGVEISGETVQARINTLPETVPRDTNALGQILNAMVNDELLRQESESITVTIDELLEERAKFLTQQGLTEETLATLMADQNISEEDFDASLESQARLQKLLDERLLLDNIEVSDDAAKEYYIQNPNQFLQA